jgi:hypothetical protein
MRSSGSGDRQGLGIALALAALALGHTVQIRIGIYTPDGFRWLIFALAAAFVGLALPAIPAVERRGRVMLGVLLGVGFAIEIAELLSARPAIYLLEPTDFQTVMPLGCALAALLAAAVFLAPRRLLRFQIPALIAVHFLMGVWLIHRTPQPGIDVWVWNQDALQQFLHGIDPYLGPLKNIYRHSAYYGPGLVRGGQVLVGLPYPPLSLFLALPGYLIAGDYRYSLLVAMSGAAVALAYARPGKLGALIACVYLFTPRVFFVLEQGWTEPFVVLFLALAVWAACRGSRLLPFALGGLFAVKQYGLLAAPFVPFLMPRPWSARQLVRIYGVSIGVAAAVTLPLALWHPEASYRSILLFQILQPFRADSLSVPAWLVANGHEPLTGWLSFGVVLPAAALAWWRAPRTPAGFAAAFGACLFVFFAFAKQAFCNYYFATFGVLCAAVAAVDPAAIISASAATGPSADARARTTRQ